MSLTSTDIETVKKLADAAATLSNVTGSDNATRGILREIELIVNPQAQQATVAQSSKKVRTPIQERIATTEASSIRGVYGLFGEIIADPETTMAEVQAVCKRLGYKNIGVIPI